jgi:flagellar biosynthesis protein FlhG
MSGGVRQAVMTRIMTIASGLAQVGKTHLAINLALELVRRGHFAGVFHDPGGNSSVEELLGLPQAATLRRREGDNDESVIMRRGYQGVDVLSCEMSVRLWPDLDAEQRLRCTGDMDVPDGYDDFLIDTSGMDARSQLACCKAAAVVIILVTPEPRSQAESFALLRVLQLNGFSGELFLIVNKVRYPVDSVDIYNSFSRLINTCLGLDIAFLGGVSEDRRVTMAQQNGQAFSSLFPDSEAAGAVIAIVDVLEEIPAQFVAGPQTLPAFLDALLEVMQTPVCLPGGVVLEDA